jgi:hypothetical protein
MSQVEVDKIIPQSGTTLTIGDSGDTITVASGATFASTGIDDNATSTAVTIDSSENVLVGKTSVSYTTVGHEFKTEGRAFHTADGGKAMSLVRKTSDGAIADFYKDGTEVGNIGTSGGGAFYVSDSVYGGLGFSTLGAGDINPCTPTGAVRDNAMDLGQPTARFKDLYLSGGAYLGGTASANHLDDYEEGTWTPTTNIGYANIYYNFYVKIGRLVFAHMYVQTNAGPGDTSQATAVSGLPFSAVSGDVISNSNIIQGLNQDVYCEIGGSSFAQRDRSDNVLITRGEYGNKYQKCTIIYYTDA